MTWDSFIYFALPALALWAGGAWTAWKKRPLPTYLLTAAGLLVYFGFILGLWLSLERPPLRTMGETRLWYAFFLPTAGLIVYSRWRYPWILAFSTILAGVFTTINLVNPDIHNKTLMPALQSPWFAPPRHRLYVCLCRTRSGGTNVCLYAVVQEVSYQRPRDGYL